MGQLSYTTAKTDSLLLRVNKMGWANYVDSTYTSGAPLTFTNERKKIECNGLGGATELSYLPDGVAALWDTTNDKILSANVGNAFDVRVEFTAEPTTTNAYFDVEFDIGGAVGIVAARTLTCPKGTNAHSYSVGIPLFSLATFVANGCTIYIDTTDDTLTLNVYDIKVFIKQDYYEA
jgi:hypothetical protein